MWYFKYFLVIRIHSRIIHNYFSKYANEASNQDQTVRSKQQELAILEQDYENEKRMKDAALLENK